MDAVSALIDHWRILSSTVLSHIHPADQASVANAKEMDFTAMPYPYVGDIRSADVWVLMLNSSIRSEDEKQEAEPYFSKRLKDNLDQNLSDYKYRLLSLDPKLQHTGTYTYYNYRNGLAKLIIALAKMSSMTEQEARQELATRLAIVQLFPYRSMSGVPSRLLGNSVPSVRLVRDAVREALKSKLVVIPRSATDWGFEYGVRKQNLFTFRANQARSASLAPGGACGGGDRILKHLRAN